MDNYLFKHINQYRRLFAPINVKLVKINGSVDIMYYEQLIKYF